MMPNEFARRLAALEAEIEAIMVTQVAPRLEQLETLEAEMAALERIRDQEGFDCDRN